MANLHELIGRKEEAITDAQQAHVNLRREYGNLLELVVQIKDGRVGIDDVEVFPPDLSWRLTNGAEMKITSL